MEGYWLAALEYYGIDPQTLDDWPVARLLRLFDRIDERIAEDKKGAGRG